MLYDISCQWSVHHRERVESSPHLDIPEGTEITYSIGLFHVHAHQPRCYPCFAPTFIPGAGNVAGEILEPCWAVLNPTASSCLTASLSYRDELLDRQMQDHNFKKMIRMVLAIIKGIEKAVKEFAAAEEAYRRFCQALPQEDIEEYDQMERTAQRNRHRDKEAMLVYDVKPAAGEPR